MYRARGVLAPELDRYRGVKQHRGCTDTGGWTGTGGGLGPRAVLAPAAGPAPGWGCTGAGSGARASGALQGPAPALGLLPTGASGHRATPVGWVAVGVLPELSLLPGLVAMGAWPVGGYQPQRAVAMGATCGADSDREPLALGVDRCVTCGNTRSARTSRDAPAGISPCSLRPPTPAGAALLLSEPGAPGLGQGVNLPGAAARAQLCPGSGTSPGGS